MARLTAEQRQVLRHSLGEDFSQPELRADERFVAPTLAARQSYIRFATAASKLSSLHWDEQPPLQPMTGDNWKL